MVRERTIEREDLDGVGLTLSRDHNDACGRGCGRGIIPRWKDRDASRSLQETQGQM